ncbi:hypothetical protein F4823DRAFT_629489 [Ustulina deusta]|nr:hypothetical protein F4823DRAFT_629489 [Ustulina deusta]
MPNDSQNVSWNLGDPIPPGAGLPAYPRTMEPIVSVETFGAGTLQDPCILYRCKPQFRNTELDQFNGFARWLCKHLGFTHIWIRAHVHDWKTQRDEITKLKTGELQRGEDNHITIYLGNRKDWINVHGDVYVSVVNARKGVVPNGLMPVESMHLQDGEPPRNLRLYSWTSKMTQISSARHTQAMGSKDWRAR